VRIVYTDKYELDLGAHVWPTAKYRLVAERLVASGVVSPDVFVEPTTCSWDDLALVHSEAYLGNVRSLELSDAERDALELPLSALLVERFRLMVGGTCTAAAIALEDGRAVHLGGGLHHAFPGHGEGFCLFNDVAVAIRRIAGGVDRRITRAAVVDCDVHHGNGTAMIFEADAAVFTFSIHQQHNYPLFKPRSTLDIGLADGAGDDEYLERLRPALKQVMQSGPEMLFYLAGADPFREDRLGGLALSHDGLRQRDREVFAAAGRVGVPVTVVLAGGYAADVNDTVTAHVNTVIELLAVRPSA
jgi:acetoin utilization deacetylase AcuC-like enzyme